MGQRPKTFDQLAELHVAGLFAVKGWRVYFPHQDDGFDFIALKKTEEGLIIRPVQVKGKYPSEIKGNRGAYGFRGKKLTQTDEKMVLAIPYFEIGDVPKLKLVAFMPFYMINIEKSGGHRCEPAKFVKGSVVQIDKYGEFFGDAGLKAIERRSWSKKKLFPDDGGC